MSLLSASHRPVIDPHVASTADLHIVNPLSTAQPQPRTVRGNRNTVAIHHWWKVDVIIAVGPKDGHFLDDCLASIAEQDQYRIASITVVDDGADLADRPGITFIKSNARHSHRSRELAVVRGTAPLIQFVDVDNKLAPTHIESCCRKFEQNPNLGIVYSDIQVFGDAEMLVRQPRHIDLTRLRQSNSCDTNSMLRREAIEQTGVMRDRMVGFEDWWIAVKLLEAGWQSEWQPVPFFYRYRQGQRSETERMKPFHVQTSLANETVTIFTPISQRIRQCPEFWQRRVAWLKSMTWPKSQIRLQFANTSGNPLPESWFAGINWQEYAGVSIYQHDLGNSGLEMVPRINQVDATKKINTAVAAIHNRALNEAKTELVLLMEDDVFPRCNDLIEKMVGHIVGDVAAVAAPYRLRFAPYQYSVWRTVPTGPWPDNIQDPGTGLEDIEGCGFGCTLVRLSQVAGIQMTANTPISEFYDADWSNRIRASGLRLRTDWSLECDHIHHTEGAAQ